MERHLPGPPGAWGMAYRGFILTCLVSSLIFFPDSPGPFVIFALLIGGDHRWIYMAFHYGLQVQFPSGIF